MNVSYNLILYPSRAWTLHFLKKDRKMYFPFYNLPLFARFLLSEDFFSVVWDPMKKTNRVLPWFKTGVPAGILNGVLKYKIFQHNLL
jgi:hypothetical protein